MKYLKSWNESLENSKIQVKIITPKVAENRQKAVWYKDGVVIAEVTDGLHTIYIDKRGDTPSGPLMFSTFTDNDMNDDGKSNFNVEYWQQKPEEFFYTISDSNVKYDEAIEIAKKSFDDPDILEIIAEHCGCEQCQLWRDSSKFGI